MRSGILELFTYFMFGALPEFSTSANSEVYDVIEYIPKIFHFVAKKICSLMYLSAGRIIQAAGHCLDSPGVPYAIFA